MIFLSKFIFSIIFLVSPLCFSQVLVFEFDLPWEETSHVDLVSGVACANPKLTCEIIYLNEFTTDSINRFKLRLQESSSTAVNISFAFEEPQTMGSPSIMTGFDYDEQRKDFNELKKAMFDTMESSPHILFSIAAGNGKGTSGPATLGVPLGEFNKLYPAVFKLKNSVRVASIESDEIDLNKVQDYKIAEYSNYSLFEVELASKVGKDKEGNILKGTSFAAPVVARLAAKLSLIDKSLTALQIKEILMKSSYVQEIDLAIKWSKDWNEKQRESILYKIHTDYKKKVRDELTQSLGGVMLVKSGGPLIEDVAYQCADNFKRAAGLLTITQACLQAHEDRLSSSKERQAKLKKLWKLRDI